MDAYILGDAPEETYEEVFDRFSILRERKGYQTHKMIGGQQQMLAIGWSLMVDPTLMLVDDVFEKIGEINEAGMAILMVE